MITCTVEVLTRKHVTRNASVCVPYTVKHSPQARNTQLVSWFAKVQYHCPRQYQKGPKKSKFKNQNVKSRWLNSWPAVDFSNSTPSILVSKSTSSSKKSKNPKKFPYFREMVQDVSEVYSNIAIFPFINSQIHHKKSPIIKSITLYTGKTKTSHR